KQALIIHGYNGSNEGNWFPWLKKELEKLEFHVDCPQFPNAAEPQEQEWTQTISDLWKPEIAQENYQKNPTDPSFRAIIGHSLGGTELLRALELNWAQPLDLAVIVGATLNDSRRPALENFFATPFDWGKIQRNCKKFILVFSDNDPHIKVETGSYIQDHLGPNAELFMLHNAGHMMKSDGFEQFPLLLELLKKNAQD
ncbi:alpha/beta hydrolase, partial [Candidatus Gracilibacteria bacterium]|nr:alpha/beta hydrolase [Candidatus Gracilibacteria bacterium]